MVYWKLHLCVNRDNTILFYSIPFMFSYYCGECYVLLTRRRENNEEKIQHEKKNSKPNEKCWTKIKIDNKENSRINFNFRETVRRPASKQIDGWNFIFDQTPFDILIELACFLSCCSGRALEVPLFYKNGSFLNSSNFFPSDMKWRGKKLQLNRTTRIRHLDVCSFLKDFVKFGGVWHF